VGDTYCTKCGEPWDMAEVYPAARGDENCALSPEEARKFLAGEGCPSCQWGMGRKPKCPSCNGWGKEAGFLADGRRGVVTCHYCNGTGEEPEDQRSEWADFWAAIDRGESPKLPIAV